MADIDPESMERLASRIAMLASDTGEADNAGRAAGAMARRLGLTGGDLKMIFLRGMAGGGFSTGTSMPRDEAERIARENLRMRHSLESNEAILRALTQEAATLRSQNETLRAAAERGKIAAQLALVAVIGLLGAVLVGAMGEFMGPRYRGENAGSSRRFESQGPVTARSSSEQSEVLTDPGGGPATEMTGGPLPEAPFARRTASPGDGAATRSAEVRAKGAAVRAAPDVAAPILAVLRPGSRVVVRRLLWNALAQWAEVEINGRSAYVATTDLDLP